MNCVATTYRISLKGFERGVYVGERKGTLGRAWRASNGAWPCAFAAAVVMMIIKIITMKEVLKVMR